MIRGSTDKVAPVMMSSHALDDSLLKKSIPTGNVIMVRSEVAISGHKNAFQFPKKLNMAKAPTAGIDNGMAIRK